MKKSSRDARSNPTQFSLSTPLFLPSLLSLTPTILPRLPFSVSFFSPVFNPFKQIYNPSPTSLDRLASNRPVWSWMHLRCKRLDRDPKIFEYGACVDYCGAGLGRNLFFGIGCWGVENMMV